MAIDAKTRQATLEDHGRIPAGDAAHRLLRDHPRGAAIYDGKIFRTTLDAVIALDAKTSKELWRKNAIDFKTGSFVDGWDPQRGEHLWRTYKIPGPGEPGRDTWTGDTWKNGGGSTWITGSFDPELHALYWGIGNPGPFNATGKAARQSLHLFSAGARSQDGKDKVAQSVLAE
jgi:alcohol dehydrogenase (cytochrome c)